MSQKKLNCYLIFHVFLSFSSFSFPSSFPSFPLHFLLLYNCQVFFSFPLNILHPLFTSSLFVFTLHTYQLRPSLSSLPSLSLHRVISQLSNSPSAYFPSCRSSVRRCAGAPFLPLPLEIFLTSFSIHQCINITGRQTSLVVGRD